MLEVVAHMISGEGLHSHRVVTENARRACCRRSGFGRHCRTDKHAVVPVPRLINKRGRARPSSAEYYSGKGYALFGIEVGRNAGAVFRGCGETAVGVRRACGLVVLVIFFGIPRFARPVNAVLGQFLGKSFPPNRHIVCVERNVGENRAALGGLKRVVITVLVGAGRNAEETVFGVDRPQSAVVAYAYPGNIVANALYLVTLFKIMLGRYKHSKVGFAASGRECRRNVFLFSVGIGNAEDKHVFRHPALVFAEVGGNSQSKAFLAQKHVSAVSGVYGNYRVILGEVHYVAFVRVHVALCMESFNKVSLLAQRVKALFAYARHYIHIQYDVYTVGNLYTYFCEVAADYTHRIRYNVHSPALHRAPCNFAAKLVALSGVHPVVNGARVIFIFGAYKGSVLYARNVVYLRAVKVTVGQ